MLERSGEKLERENGDWIYVYGVCMCVCLCDSQRINNVFKTGANMNLCNHLFSKNEYIYASDDNSEIKTKKLPLAELLFANVSTAM